MNEAEKAEMCCVFSFSTTTTDNNSVTAFANSLNILEQFFSYSGSFYMHALKYSLTCSFCFLT